MGVKKRLCSKEHDSVVWLARVPPNTSLHLTPLRGPKTWLFFTPVLALSAVLFSLGGAGELGR